MATNFNPVPTRNSHAAFPLGDMTPGGPAPDDPIALDSATIGLKLNHLCFRIRDPVRSLYFYVTLLGMRTIFTWNTGPLTIIYLGYPQTDAHRSDPKAYSQDMLPDLTHAQGLIELIHIHGSESDESFAARGGYSTGNAPPHLGFSHLGFTCSDARAQIERLRAAGIEIVKDVGVIEKQCLVDEWEEQRGWAKGELHQNFTRVFRGVGLVRDPVSGS
ncbi:hypothetical protein H2204_010279 [Knufia peltigerae]|uniref:VOC domain-containing protein n=1 Tax=Knufia peltigerae TaxID=1002370 RepID=A0AA39CV49_9EURO|nr:hypothetical protein H2204_010279 [Knufia peltigerae]